MLVWSAWARVSIFMAPSLRARVSIFTHGQESRYPAIPPSLPRKPQLSCSRKSPDQIPPINQEQYDFAKDSQPWWAVTVGAGGLVRCLLPVESFFNIADQRAFEKRVEKLLEKQETEANAKRRLVGARSVEESPCRQVAEKGFDCR